MGMNCSPSFSVSIKTEARNLLIISRLQTFLNRIVKMRTISPLDSDKQLLKQFCRGCWNNNLQLEKRKDNPPTFPEFLLLLHTEEDKQTAKANRMKQHLGSQKPQGQVAAHAHEVYFGDTYDSPPSFSDQPPAMEQLQKQIVELQAQIAALSSPKQTTVDSKPAKKKEKDKQKEKPATKKTPTLKLTSETSTKTVKPKPKPWYCFH